MVHYKDDATAGDGEKKGTIRDKGIVNNKLSNALMQKLEKEGVPTHYVEELNDRDTLVKKVEIVPARGHHPQRCGRPFQPSPWACPKAPRSRPPILEFSYKNDDLHDPFINHYYALALGPGHPGRDRYDHRVCFQGQRGAQEDPALMRTSA